MSNSAVTGRPGRSASISTTARCFGGRVHRGPSDRTSSGPRSATCTRTTLGGPFAGFLWIRTAVEPKARVRIPRLYRALPGYNQHATVEAKPERERPSERSGGQTGQSDGESTKRMRRMRKRALGALIGNPNPAGRAACI